MLPTLVRKTDLLGAISLNSVMINGSRVMGPVIVAILSQFGVDHLAVLPDQRADLPVRHLRPAGSPTCRRTGARRRRSRRWRRFTSGCASPAAGRRSRRLLLTLFTFSLISLPFVGLFPAVARLNFGIDEEGSTYKWLYATWGLGACLGGLAIGTVFVAWDQRRLIQLGFLVVRREPRRLRPRP